MNQPNESTLADSVFRADLFKDKVILVPGGASGLGKASALQFARLGATVVICGRDTDKLAEATKEIEATGIKVMSKAMTIRDPEQVSALMDDIWRLTVGSTCWSTMQAVSSRSPRSTCYPKAGQLWWTPTSTALGT